MYERCVDWHRRNGTHRVLYPDGLFSQAFTYDVACDYRDLFGGMVVNRDYPIHILWAN